MIEQTLTLFDIMALMQYNFLPMDEPLQRHVIRVTYLFHSLLRYTNHYTDSQLEALAVTAFFHDIGVYKTQDSETLMDFDGKGHFEHAIYGGLFLKYFSPIPQYAPIVTYHHLPYAAHPFILDGVPEEAALLHLCDRISVIYDRPDLEKRITSLSGSEFKKDHIQLFLRANQELRLISRIQSNTFREDLKAFLGKKPLPQKDILRYTSMILYALVYRSPATIIHTIQVEYLTSRLARDFQITGNQLTLIVMSSLLHDIGKIGVPIEILEKPGRLTPEEYEIMKKHASITYDILNFVGDPHLRDVASYHHEKLNGSGYPFGLKGDEICFEARILGVADVVSALACERSYKHAFSKGRIVSILQEMKEKQELDEKIVRKFTENYDRIMEEVKNRSKNTVQILQNIHQEYEQTRILLEYK